MVEQTESYLSIKYSLASFKDNIEKINGGYQNIIYKTEFFLGNQEWKKLASSGKIQDDVSM